MHRTGRVRTEISKIIQNILFHCHVFSCGKNNVLVSICFFFSLSFHIHCQASLNWELSNNLTNDLGSLKTIIAFIMKSEKDLYLPELAGDATNIHIFAKKVVNDDTNGEIGCRHSLEHLDLC